MYLFIITSPTPIRSTQTALNFNTEIDYQFALGLKLWKLAQVKNILNCENNHFFLNIMFEKMLIFLFKFMFRNFKKCFKVFSILV